MSELCEVLEELVVATSSCPATDVIMVVISGGGSSSATVSGPQPPVLVGEALAVASVDIEAYAILAASADGTSELVTSTNASAVLASSALARDRLFAALDELAASTAAAAGGVVSMDIPNLLVSVGASSSTVIGSSIAGATLTSSALAKSLAMTGASEDVSSSAQASSTVVLLRRATETLVSSAEATDSVETSGSPQVFLLISAGDATSAVMLQQDTTLVLESEAEAGSDVWFKNPARKAWVMNTETGAASWYDNFDFESIAQPPGRVLAVGPDGLYELAGDTDSGERIDAEVTSGFTDFGAQQTKRIDAMYFGYTSSGQLSVTAETYESGHAPATYLLEQRDADAPRNSRVRVGKGLFGRYWRLSIRNVEGVDFEVHDATVDIATSSRRV